MRRFADLMLSILMISELYRLPILIVVIVHATLVIPRFRWSLAFMLRIILIAYYWLLVLTAATLIPWAYTVYVFFRMVTVGVITYSHLLLSLRVFLAL